MSNAPGYVELADKAGISRSYANEIINGRAPKRPLAIHIMRATGWRHPSIAELSDADIAALERIEPWKPAPVAKDTPASLSQKKPSEENSDQRPRDCAGAGEYRGLAA